MANLLRNIIIFLKFFKQKKFFNLSPKKKKKKIRGRTSFLVSHAFFGSVDTLRVDYMLGKLWNIVQINEIRVTLDVVYWVGSIGIGVGVISGDWE